MVEQIQTGERGRWILPVQLGQKVGAVLTVIGLLAGCSLTEKTDAEKLDEAKPINVTRCHKEYIAHMGDNSLKIIAAQALGKGVGSDEVEDLSFVLEKTRMVEKDFSATDAVTLYAGRSLIYLPADAKVGKPVNC